MNDRSNKDESLNPYVSSVDRFKKIFENSSIKNLRANYSTISDQHPLKANKSVDTNDNNEVSVKSKNQISSKRKIKLNQKIIKILSLKRKRFITKGVKVKVQDLYEISKNFAVPHLNLMRERQKVEKSVKFKLNELKVNKD